MHPIWDAFSCPACSPPPLAQPLLQSRNTSHMGCVFVFGLFWPNPFLQTHHQPSHLGRLVVFGGSPPQPSNQTRKCVLCGTCFHVWLILSTTDLPILACWWCSAVLHPSPPTRHENASHMLAHSFPPEHHQCAHLGMLVVLLVLLHPNPFPPEYHNPSRHENVSHMEHVFVSRYIHTRTPPMCPKWARWWCSAGSPPLPFLQADTKMCPTWGTFSCLLPTFPPHLSPFPLNTKKCPLR